MGTDTPGTSQNQLKQAMSENKNNSYDETFVVNR